jgi:hypothetical protein
MPLTFKRLGATQKEPLCIELDWYLISASALLWYVTRLPGAKVLSKCSFAMTDEFCAYFLYKNRLFVMETPFSKIWVSLVGHPADEPLFAEIEARVSTYSFWVGLLWPLLFLRYIFVPFRPRSDLLEAHESRVS